MQQCVLKAEGLVKRFPGTVALNGARIELYAGECVGLVGENGAGKSTMMNIISGSLQADEGTVTFQGREVKFHNPRESILAGIGFVHQELALCQHLTAAENIFMGRLDTMEGKTVNWKILYQKTDKLLEDFQADFKSSRRVSSLSVAQQQMIEIAKALSMNAKVIILDEPTSSLTDKETEVLFKTVKKLKKDGVAIIYISHRMSEIFEICDRVTVMRDGVYVKSMNVKEVTEQEIVSSMVGRNITNLYPEKNREPVGEEVLRVENLSGKGFTNVSFTVRKGEILGFSGLVGAGRSEVARAVCGIDRYTQGEIYFYGEKLNPSGYGKRIEKGICYLTEDRKKNGLFLKMSVEQNISVSMLKQIASNGVVNKKKEEQLAKKTAEQLGVKLSSVKQHVGSLSGGNQQKVMLGRWLASSPRLIIMDEPTRGIDVGAKCEIHNLLRRLSNQGVCIIVISSEMPEVMGLSDRIIVMHEGRVMGELSGEEITENNIMTAASGSSGGK